jgi:hypothetical protein
MKQFASTFEEFHYLMVGFAVGLIFGWITGSIFTSSIADR